jgi:TRAP-type C4-dicarboxylate transport system permease small subunit
LKNIVPSALQNNQATLLKKALEKLERAGRIAENTALVVLLGTMMLVAVFQIVNRQLLGSMFAIPWADELVRFIVLWLAMVGSIAACRDNKHIRIDAITHVLSGVVVSWIKIAVDVFAAIVCAIIGWQAFRLVREEVSWGDYVIGDIPLWLAHAVVPVAFFLISYQFAVRVLRLAYGIFRSDAAEVGA